jgi:hypothetical protein
VSAELEILPARPRGRPSLYEGAYCERVLELAAEGCGKAEIAAAFSVSRKTLDAWAKAHAEFREAMSRAKDLEYAWWLAAGRKGQFIKSWNAASWALQMRNRFGRRFRERMPPPQPYSGEEPKDAMHADRLRAEIECKLSRIAEASLAEEVSCQPDAAGAGEPEV